MPAVQVRSMRQRKGTSSAQVPTAPLIPVAPDDWMDDREVLEDKDLRVDLWEQRLGDEPDRTPSRAAKAGDGSPSPESPE